MQKCKQCGWEFPDDIHICPYCGHPVEPDDRKKKRRFRLRWHQSGLAPSPTPIPVEGMTPAKSLRHLKWHPGFLALASAFVLAGLVAGLVLIARLPGHAQTPPVLILSGIVVPGGNVSIQGRNFSPGETVTLTIDGHSATVASDSSTAQHLPPKYGLASLPLSALAPQTAQISSTGTLVSVKNDGTFEAPIQVDPHWLIGSSHHLVATEQSSGRQARLTLVVPRQAELVSCSSSTRTTNIALGPVPAGQKQPVSAVFTLCTTGSGMVQWTASWNQQQAKWLQVDRSGQIQAPLSKQLKISALASSLKAGVYSATVTFSYQNSPAKLFLRVMFIVRSTQATDCLNISTQSLAFTTFQGQASPGPLMVKLSNCGALGSWSATTHTDNGANWLSVKPVSSQLKGKASTDIAVSVSSSPLGPGIYTGQVTFKLGTAIAVVDVMLTVQPTHLSCISVAPQSLTFSATVGQGNPASQVTTVGNCGQAGSWSATASTADGGNWLTINPATGNLAANATQDVSITVSSSNLQIGTYSGLVTFKMGSSLATVSLAFTILPPWQKPCLWVNTPSLPFTATQGQADPAPQTITLTNCGPSGSWSASTANGSSWLGINPATGNLNAGATQDVTVSASIAGLPAGQYSDTIIFTISTGSGTAQATVAVSLKVQSPPPCIQASASSLSFVATQGQADPAPQTITLTNCGPSGSWSASTANGSSWLGINPATGNLNAGATQDVTVSASIADLLADSYSDTLTFTISTGSGTAPAPPIAVSLTVQPPPPAQLCNIQGTNLGELQQGQSKSGVITFGNCGGQPLQWTASFTAGWDGVTLNKSTGTVAPNSTGQISVTATAGSADLGKLSATFTITSNGGTGKVKVSVTVVPPPCLLISAVNGYPPSDPSNVTIDVTPPASLKVEVKNCGTVTGILSAAVSTSDKGNWLSTDLQPDTRLAGGGTQTVTITISKSAPYGATGTVTLTLKTSGGTATVTINIGVSPG